MKFIAALTISAAALVATASADMLQINNPTDGTIWKTGVPNFVGWSGNCASMGNDSKAVKVDLVNGPSSAVRYVATLGTLDCSGSNTRADMTVPGMVPSGPYSIVVRTSPQQSYTNSFQIDNPAQPAQASVAPEAASTLAPTIASASSTNTSNGASVQTMSFLKSGAMFMLAGAAGLCVQLL